ncbi:MAG: DUF4124 domain-containing protein [bacterium]
MARSTSLRPGSRLLVVFALLLGLGWLASDARAQAYKYKDERGHVHFTENLYEVPARYRSQVETRDMPVHVPPAGSAEAKSAPPAEGSVAASFQQRIQDETGQSFSPKQQEAMNAWMKYWMLPFGAAVLINLVISFGLIIHAFTQGHVGWGIANFLIGVTSPVYLMMHVEQPVTARVGLLALYLSPIGIAVAAALQLASALA